MACCLALTGCGKDEGWDPNSGQSLYDYNMEHGLVATNDYDYDKLETYEGRHYYVDNSKVTSRVGIDVSTYNGGINWSKVAAQGVDFAYIRAGYRGVTEGGLFQDERFEKNFKRAKKYGLQVGVYFFSQALNADEAHEEAEFLLNILGDSSMDLPVVFDLERSSEKGSRTKNISVDQATEAALAFGEDLRDAGYNVMIYMNKQAATNMFDLSKLQDYSFWYAEYGVDNPTLDFDFCTWQYRDDGSAFGIGGNVDMNIMFKKPVSNHN